LEEPKRRAQGELKSAMRAYLAQKHGGAASIPEIREAVERVCGPVPHSSIRSGLQDERYFVRVNRGVFRLRA
jgi:hypothetical protein